MTKLSAFKILCNIKTFTLGTISGIFEKLQFFFKVQFRIIDKYFSLIVKALNFNYYDICQKKIRAPVAQVVVHPTSKQEVRGSIPEPVPMEIF